MILLFIFGIILIILSIIVFIIDRDSFELDVFVFSIGFFLTLFGWLLGIYKQDYLVRNLEKESNNFYRAVIILGENEEYEVLLTVDQAKFYQDNYFGKITQEKFNDSYELEIRKTRIYVREGNYEENDKE